MGTEAESVTHGSIAGSFRACRITIGHGALTAWAVLAGVLTFRAPPLDPTPISQEGKYLPDPPHHHHHGREDLGQAGGSRPHVPRAPTRNCLRTFCKEPQAGHEE